MATISTDGGNSTDSKDKAPAPIKLGTKKKKDDPERNKRSQAHHNQARVNQTKQQMTRALSCVPENARIRRGQDPYIPIAPVDTQEIDNMLNHLKKLAPFNQRWEINAIINSGSFGVVYAVTDVVTKSPGVIKIAKATNDTYVNVQAEWEAFILEKIYKSNHEASIVRILDKGMLQNWDQSQLEFMCLEFVGLRMHEHLAEYTGKERELRCCQISLMTLKGVYDIHNEGLLHRDLKPDNMGLLSREHPVVVVYDLGMARMYTDGAGKLRPYRCTTGFRGTMEWASGNAMKGREQTRYDDLIAWLYCMIELFHGNKDSNQVFPWSSRPKNGKESQYFRSMFSPAKYLLRKCPKSYFAINTYLQTAHRHTKPDYGYIADRLKDAMEEVVPGSSADLTIMTKSLPPEKPLSGKPADGTAAAGVGSKETTDGKNAIGSKEAVKNV